MTHQNIILDLKVANKTVDPPKYYRVMWVSTLKTLSVIVQLLEIQGEQINIFGAKHVIYVF